MDYATVRREHASALAELRASKDRLHRRRVEVECALLVRANGDSKAVGSNEADRKRAFDLACDQDDEYRDEQASCRQLEHAVESLAAEIDIYQHEQRERELCLRERALVSLDTARFP